MNNNQHTVKVLFHLNGALRLGKLFHEHSAKPGKAVLLRIPQFCQYIQNHDLFIIKYAIEILLSMFSLMLSVGDGNFLGNVPTESVCIKEFF